MSKTSIALSLLSCMIVNNAIAQQKSWQIGMQVSGQAYVVDGDTIDIMGHRLRFFGIDAPESSQTCLDRMNQAYMCGLVSKQRLQALTHNKNVDCVVADVDRRYNRGVARCFVEGRDLNRQMVADGMAFAYVKYSSDYVNEEKEARAAQRGIFANSANTPPWDYRHKPNIPMGVQVPAMTQQAPIQTPNTSATPMPPALASGCNIKGNINSKGNRIYHMPGQRDYENVKIDASKGEALFCSETEAQQSGFRRSFQ